MNFKDHVPNFPVARPSPLSIHPLPGSAQFHALIAVSSDKEIEMLRVCATFTPGGPRHGLAY